MRLSHKVLLPTVALFAVTIAGAGFLSYASLRDKLYEESYFRHLDEVNSHILKHLKREMFAPSATPEEAEPYRRHFVEYDEGVRNSYVGRLTIWNTQGTVVYSDLNSLIGHTSEPLDDGLRQVLDTRQPFYRYQERDNGSPRQSDFGPFLEVFIPVHLDGQFVGVIEEHNPTALIIAPLRQEAIKLGLYLGGAGLLIVLSIIFIIRTYVLRPIDVLRTFTKRVGEGELTQSLIPSTAEDEISDLERDFERARKLIAESYSRIESEKDGALKISRELKVKALELEEKEAAMLNMLEDVQEAEQQAKHRAKELEKAKTLLEQQKDEMKKFQQAVDASFDHMIITDPEGVVLYANHAAEVMTGYATEEMVGQRPSLWGKQMPPEFYETFWQTIKTEKQGYAGEITNRRKDGSTYLASIRVAPIFNTQGEVMFYVGIERDITEERQSQLRIVRHTMELERANKKVEAEKERAESILRFLQSINENVYVVDVQRKIIFINHATAALLKLDSDEVVGTHMSDHFIYENAEGERYLPTHKVLKDQKSHTFPEHTFVKLGKKKLAVSGDASPIFNNKNVLMGVVVVFQDMQARYELEQMKDNFLSVAAHQLRTPLGSMRWSMELLLSGDLGKLPKTAKESVQQVYENSGRMLLLVNDLLDVSRIDRERGKEELKPVDIAAMLQEVTKALQSGADKRHVTIHIKLPKRSIPAIMAPPKHLFEALENIISNGIKYNREKGLLTISVKHTDTAIELEFADTGIGIPERDQNKIFSKFYRATNAIQKETEGSGLGLSVVKSYLEEAGAKVRFESTENVGTTFFVRFPFKSTET